MKIVRWYSTIQEFPPKSKYLPGHANVVADALLRNGPVEAVTGPPSPLPNFTLHELGIAQRMHDVWSKVIHALKSGDETSLPRLPIPFLQFFLSQDKVLSQYWAEKAETVDHFVMPEIYAPVVLSLIHDTPIAGHLGRDRILTTARKVYYWPNMRTDIDNYVARCVTYADHKVMATGPAPMLQYPRHEQAGYLVSMDLLPTAKEPIFWCASITFYVLWFLHQSKTKQPQL